MAVDPLSGTFSFCYHGFVSISGIAAMTMNCNSTSNVSSFSLLAREMPYPLMIPDLQSF